MIKDLCLKRTSKLHTVYNFLDNFVIQNRENVRDVEQ